jgi:hypothetical protein
MESTPIVSDITTFFTSSTRADNDKVNKIREKILELISNNLFKYEEYKQDNEFGKLWTFVSEEWFNIIKIDIEFTHIKYVAKGGRKFNYDGIVMYYNNRVLVAETKIEFKKGGTTIGDQPQFLSLQAKYKLFDKTYDVFYYENYLDKYIACDSLINQIKPSLNEYLKQVTKTSSTHPFFTQLKSRDCHPFFKNEKDLIVNTSISDYLDQYGKSININAVIDKVSESQCNKLYLLWDKKFWSDKFIHDEISQMKFHGIKNGNVIQLKSGNTIYDMLLRWRNHKGILNPAWQISMKRK